MRAVWGVLLVAGCVAVERVGPAERMLPVLADRCGVAQVSAVMGQPFVGLAEYRLPGTLRVLYPEQVVTREVQPMRLNAAVDGTGRVVALFCG
ncbi:MAG: I78 family peptidase inhibitor [Paracoccaceae bacterium]